MDKIQFRNATTEEIERAFCYDIQRKRRVSFRHFVRECYNPRTKSGVSHR
jgi:hypothetical protein